MFEHDSCKEFFMLFIFFYYILCKKKMMMKKRKLSFITIMLFDVEQFLVIITSTCVVYIVHDDFSLTLSLLTIALQYCGGTSLYVNYSRDL